MAITNQPGTNLGPLTTTWAIPETCTEYMPQCPTCAVAYAGQSCNAANGGSPRDNTACWPPAKTGVTSPAWPIAGWGFYSPGLACPSGYISACTAVYGQRPDWPTQFNLFEGETAIGCCPSGFACDNRNGNTCVSTVASSTPVLTADCDGTTVTNVATHVFPDIIFTTTTATNGAVASAAASRTMVLLAPMFQLNFKSSDIPTSSPTSAPTNADRGPTGSLSQTTAATTTTPSSSTDTGSHQGLSTGAKAGIGAGVAVGALALAGLVAFLFFRKKSHAKFEDHQEIAMDERKVPEVPEPTSGTHELHAPYFVELPAGGEGNTR